MELILQSDVALDQDRLTMQLIIIALLLIAVLLGFLTFWYWKQTDPRRATARQALAYGGMDAQAAYPADDGFQHQPAAYEAASQGPLVSQGPGTRPGSPAPVHPFSAPPAPPQGGGDSWAALTSAEPNGFEKP